TGRRLFILGNSFSKPIPLNPFPFLYIPQFSRFTLLVYLTLSHQRVVAHVGEDAWRGWRNGLEIRLRLDPQHFVGASGVLFSAVLAQFFSLYATANRFVRTVLVEADKEVKTWQPQAGSPLSL
ncbi:type VI secretion system baseplate subunit TssF, partial [Pseudomonas aeruginosa]